MQLTKKAPAIFKYIVFILVFSSANVSGAEFEYPELSVTPRASDRLEMEAAKETQKRWTTHIPIQVSALATLTAGVLQFGSTDLVKDPDKRAGWAGILVGGGWLAATALMATNYQPYGSAQQDVSALPRKSQREQLTRERIAEERINAAARLGRKIQWLSVLTNAGAAIYMNSNAEPGSFSKVVDGATIAFAVAPLFFRYHWIDVAEEQRDYKKRIYAPVASATVFAEPGSGRLAPGLALALGF